MVEFGKISWEISDKNESQTPKRSKETSINILFELSEKKFAGKNLKNACSKFEDEKERLDQAYKTSEKVFAKTPFVAAFLTVVKELLEKHENCSICLDEARMLLEHGFIGVKDNKGDIWNLEHVLKQDPNVIFQAIRCHREWPMQSRERLVTAYYIILHSLDIATKGFLKFGEKIDVESHVFNRAIDYKFFTKILDNLNEKSQLVAKLLYFGGNRNLDEVLKLSIEEVDFEKRLIKFGSESVSYPLHIFADIKAICENRINGRVFLGRQNLPLNAATIFRNFNEAGKKLGLPAFSPSVLLR